MKMLLLTFYYPPDLCAGSFRAQSLVDALRVESGPDVQIDVVTTMPNRYRSHSQNIKADKVEKEAGVTIHRLSLPNHHSKLFDQAKAFAWFAHSALQVTRGQQWDVVVATSSRLMTAALGALIARRVHAPLYLDIRDLFTDTMADLLSRNVLKLALPALCLLERLTWNSADRINLVSAGFLPYAQRLAPQHEFRLFTNGIDDEIPAMDNNDTNRFEKHPLLIVYAGNFGDGQGLHNVIPEAAKLLLGKAFFRLIGDGGKREILESILHRDKITNVEILDPMPRSELYRHYQDADILFMHLNDHDAFKKVLPSKLFEYAATGKPLLAGVAGYAAEFLQNNIEDAAIFPPCDPEGLILAFNDLREAQPANRTAFRIEFARSRIMRKMARDVLSIYNPQFPIKAQSGKGQPGH